MNIKYKSVVLKFGGSVIPDMDAVGRVANVIKKLTDRYDIRAVIVAVVCGADFCWFFKNGGGICDKKPNKEAGGEMFQKISYTRMHDLMTGGRGQVLHKRSIDLAKKYQIPLYVSGIDDFNNGTWILSRVHVKLR